MARGIYKRGNVYWIRYAGLDGAEIRESSGSNKFKDAEAILIKRKQAVKEGTQPLVKNIGNHTFSELVPQYLKWAERQKSYESKVWFIKELEAAFGNLSLSRFNSMLVEQYQTDKLKKGNKPATVNRHLATLKHMFTKAVEWEMAGEEAYKHVRRVKLLKENNRRLRYLSAEECAALVDACLPHLRPIVITALHTGMRKTEILNLTWDKVDLRHGFILLSVTKNGERREIPIDRTLRAELEKLAFNIEGRKHVFHDHDGKPYQDVKKSFNSACKTSGITDFHFHDLRHTFASQLVMAGVDLTTVKELLGHKTLAMTLRYAHLAPAHKVKALDTLDRTLADKSANRTKTAQKKGYEISSSPVTP